VEVEQEAKGLEGMRAPSQMRDESKIRLDLRGNGRIASLSAPFVEPCEGGNGSEASSNVSIQDNAQAGQ